MQPGFFFFTLKILGQWRKSVCDWWQQPSAQCHYSKDISYHWKVGQGEAARISATLATQSGVQWPNQGSFRVQATALPEATGEGGVYRWVGGWAAGGVGRGGAWTRIRGIPDEGMFLWMSAATFYTTPRNGTTDGHKIYTANILMFYSPVWETLCKEWGNTGAKLEQSGTKKEMMI